MKKIEIVTQEAIPERKTSITVFDNLDEYLNVYNEGNDFVRVGFGDWNNKIVNGEKLYYFSNSWHINYDELFITEKTYLELLKHCQKTYKIFEKDLVRTGKYSNTRFTGDLESEEEVIEYMLDNKRSWLPNVFKAIDEDIEEYKGKIKQLEEKIKLFESQKELLVDVKYLKNKIVVDYIFDSKKYKEKNEVNK